MMAGHDHLILILYKLERIFPPAFFDIMIHLIMHLSKETILGGLMHVRWMYPFEQYLKKLNNYVRNQAYPVLTSVQRRALYDTTGDTSFINDEDVKDDTHEEYENDETCSESNEDYNDDDEDQMYHDSNSD
ncbi:DUF4218 domain-containing protein [Abeliophyllum distichum]|uniref:DUF4218 domain-containing protein n=1 Tax=Abeliophyllum distichum TaxID=126358 RepID=A0ABD1U0M2_9LAMI